MEFYILMYNNQKNNEIEFDKEKKTLSKKKKSSALTNTFFRNALKSNLDLTALADTKAGMLISINGFILTVGVTASSFIAHNDLMAYAFICIILTSLGSIVLSVLSVKPRIKEKLVKKEYLKGYSSLLYYQDIANYAPDEYQKRMKKSLQSTKESRKELVSHLHILSAEIKKKYHWLKIAYTFFSLGLIVSAFLIIYALADANRDTKKTNANKSYHVGKFYNIFEPSGATTVDKNKVLIVEDESTSRPLKLITFDEKNSVVEVGDLYIPKKLRKSFKKKIEDLEAITSDAHTIYAITSHSLSHSNKEKKSRNKLLMMHYEDESITNLSVYKDLKKELIKYKPKIFANNLLGYNPINIEGISANLYNHKLYIGFRAPLFHSKAIIVPIQNPQQLFAKRREKPLFNKPIFINLHGLGIRGMYFDALKKGLWILAGDSGNRTSEFQLYFYNLKTKIATIEKKDIDLGYSEGITMVTNNGKKFLFCVQDNGAKPNKSANYIRIELDK